MNVAPALNPGAELADRYRVLRLLGEGGMGAVYEAEHMIIGRKVAVKVLHPKFCAQHDAVVRFTREARAAAAIGHENIVDVTDFGTHDGQPFLVMELLRGITLDEEISDAEPVAPERACEIVGHVLSALASAHAAGIVHRDLKPENIFLADVGTRTVVKILDFGISKFQEPLSENLHTTEEGAMLGTPSYMSPEQWLSERDIDHRSDLFAMGVLFYELLTGRLPYEGTNRGELMLAVVTGAATPPPPSALVEGIPEGLDAVALRGVARDKSARFQSAQDFLDALRPFGAAQILATPSMPASRLYGPASEPPGFGAPRALTSARPASRAVPTLQDSPTPDPTALEASIVPPPLWRTPSVLLGALGVAALLGGLSILSRGPVAATRPPVRPAAARPAPPATARLELRGVPAGASVKLDGAPATAPELRVPRDGAAHHLEVSLGAVRRELTVRGDADQVLLIDLAPPPPVPAPVEPEPEGRHRDHHGGRHDPPTGRHDPPTGPHEPHTRRHRGLDIHRDF